MANGDGDAPLHTAARLTRLAVPIAFGRLGGIVTGLTDMIVVGQFAPGELAILGLGWTLNGPALLGGFGLLLGVQVFAARAVGEGHPAAAGAIWRRGLVVAAATGVLIAAIVMSITAPLYALFGIAPAIAVPGAHLAGILALSVPLILAFQASTNFLEGVQRPLPGAAAMWLGNGLNLALNLLLVPRFGALGSAYATVLSRLALFGGLALYIIVAPAIRPYLARVASGAGYGALLAIGIAAAISSGIEAGAFTVLSVFAARESAEAIAAFGLATGGLLTLVNMISQGYAAAGTVLVSDAIGRGTAPGRLGWMAVAIIVAAMAVCGIASVLFAPEIARGFTADPATIAALTGVMVLVALLMIPDGAAVATDQILRAYGDNWLPTALRLAPFVLFAPALAYYLAEVRHLGLTGVFLALLAASTTAFVAQTIRLAMLKAR